MILSLVMKAIDYFLKNYAILIKSTIEINIMYQIQEYVYIPIKMHFIIRLITIKNSFCHEKNLTLTLKTHFYQFVVFKSTHCQNTILIDWMNKNRIKFNTLVWNTDLNKEIENYNLFWREMWSPASSKSLTTIDHYYFNLDNGIPNYYFQIESIDIEFWQINSKEDILVLLESSKIISKYNVK